MILDDFTLIRFLGGGTSGTVHLVREKSTGLLYALKSMPKFDERNAHRVFGERDALLLFQGEDRVMQFYASFHDNENFYIVTEYLPAGDLYTLIHRRGDFSRDDARQYAAELLLAIETIHQRGVIHRDLKPENIMIAMDGHLVLADFGLAWRLDEHDELPKNRAGTPEYCAPEVLQEKSYAMEVDLWSFGVILYEMLGRQLPFDSSLNIPRKDRKWLDCLRDRVVYNDLDFRGFNFSYDARDLLQKLLAKSRRDRITSIPEIKKHKYFSTIDWKNLATLSCSAPWKPHFVPTEPGSNPVPVPTISPPSSSPYSSGDDPYPDFSTRSYSPCLEAESCCIDTELVVTWEKSQVCENCVRRCRLGHVHGSKMDARSKVRRGWMRRFFHKSHHV